MTCQLRTRELAELRKLLEGDMRRVAALGDCGIRFALLLDRYCKVSRVWQ